MRTILIGLLLFSLSFASLMLYESGAFLMMELDCPSQIDYPYYFSGAFVEGASSFHISTVKEENVTLYTNNGNVFRGSLISSFPIKINISNATYVFPDSSVEYYVVDSTEKRVLVLEGNGSCKATLQIPYASWSASYVLNGNSLEAFATLNLPEDFDMTVPTKLIAGSVNVAGGSPRIFKATAVAEDLPSISPEENSFYYSYDLGNITAKPSTVRLFYDKLNVSTVNVFEVYGPYGSTSSARVVARFTPNSPMPKGKLLFIEDGMISGLPTVPNLPAGKEASLSIGNSFTVFGEFSASLKDNYIKEDVEKRSYEIDAKIRNFGSRLQKFEIRVAKSPYVEIKDVSNADLEEDSTAFILKGELSAGEEKAISFVYVEKLPRRGPY